MVIALMSCQKRYCGIIKDKDIRSGEFYLKVDNSWIKVTAGSWMTYDIGDYECFE
jgi:hypothetical protein